MNARHRVSKTLLRHGRVYPGPTTWTAEHRRWLSAQRFDKPASELLERTRSDLADALAELRELARGIHPSLLTDRGLKAALEALASRALMPVELAAIPDERLPDGLEAAAYYLVAEALTNVAKCAIVHGTRSRRSSAVPMARCLEASPTLLRVFQYWLCYVRGPAGIIVELAEKIG